MMPKRRNPVARSPLLRKGGPHERAKSAEREKKNRELDKETDSAMKERAQKKRKKKRPTTTRD